MLGGNVAYTIGVILALVPPLTENNFKAKLCKIYAFAMSFVLLSLIIFSVYYRYHGDYLAYSISAYGVLSVAIDVLLSCALGASLCICILKASVCNSNTFMQFLRSYRSFPTYYKQIKSFQLALVHIAFILVAVLNVYVALHVGGIFLVAIYFHLIIDRYYNTILVIIITNFVLTMKCYIRNLNKSLENVKKSDGGECAWKKVKYTRISFKNYNELVKTFNTLFGWQMLFVTFAMSLEFLEIVHGVIWYFYHLQEAPSFKFSEVVAIMLAWCVLLLVMGTIIAVTCDMTTKEAKRTAAICYTNLSGIHPVNNSIEDKTLKEELILLAQHATHQCPYFSAADYFKMDHTMLFGLLGTVMAYIILLIQINK